MNDSVLVNLMLTGVMFALIIAVLTIGAAAAFSAYVLGVPPDISFIAGSLVTIVAARWLIEVIDASI